LVEHRQTIDIVDDSQTVRFGVEYRFWSDPTQHVERVAARAGYVYDSKTANAEYPTPFGTPPGPTQSSPSAPATTAAFGRRTSPKRTASDREP
jgi:hypothetical protein